MAQLIDGKMIAKNIRDRVGIRVKELNQKGINPCLNVILVGEDPASQVYVRNKEKACAEAGIVSEIFRLSEITTTGELKNLIKRLNSDAKVHGILVQLPLPKHINQEETMIEISPVKDVDGLHPINMGRLLKGEHPYHTSCTPLGIVELIKSTGVEIKGREVVIVGRSNIVGKPVAILMLEQHATVTICHSRTNDLAEHCLKADILIFSVGKPKICDKSYIKPGAVVIDVGMNRLESGLVGDVDFDSAKEVAGWITPVPGGVGPMTIAMLLQNTINAVNL